MAEPRGSDGSTIIDVRERVFGVAHGMFRRAWWAIALRGLLAIVLGVVILTRPAMSLAVLLVAVGAYLFLDGLLALVATFHAAREDRSWWPYLLQGLVGVAAGMLVFAEPVAAALVLLLLIAVRSVITGIVEIGSAVSLKRDTGSREWALWIAGIASIAFGLLLVWVPAAGILTLVWLIGIYALVFGIDLTIVAFRTRALAARVHESHAV
jgi:uncharacterized membrane protein HdeD (DUF308 family)